MQYGTRIDVMTMPMAMVLFVGTGGGHAGGHL